MKPYDPKSKELAELEDIEEERLHAELGRCPGPLDLWSHEVGRRGFLKVGTASLFSLLMAQWLDPRAEAQFFGSKKPKSCILLWMNGGPSHLDTWDPKPGAATGGPFQAIKTRAPEIQICQHMPQVADVADKIAIVRSMSSKEGNHQRAQYL